MSGTRTSSASAGFAWQLSPLHSKLNLALDQARSGCGALQMQALVAAQELLATTKRQADEAAMLDAAARSSLDLDGRTRGLHYLGVILAGAAIQSRHHEAAQARVEDARAACVALEMRIACLDEVRERLLRAHSREQMMREAREADAAWLGERQRRRAVARGDGAMP